jgi:hypothetical protein
MECDPVVVVEMVLRSGDRMKMGEAQLQVPAVVLDVADAAHVYSPGLSNAAPCDHPDLIIYHYYYISLQPVVAPVAAPCGCESGDGVRVGERQVVGDPPVPCIHQVRRQIAGHYDEAGTLRVALPVGTLNDDNTMHFLLAGSPGGDPGLTFLRR